MRADKSWHFPYLPGYYQPSFVGYKGSLDDYQDIIEKLHIKE